MILFSSLYDSPVGTLHITCSSSYLISISYTTADTKNIEQNKNILCCETEKQLTEYFCGQRKEFSVPYRFISGTPFQKKVWEQLALIKYGETVSYKDIAESAGSPKACRAVGNANRKNPIAIIVPCHRVISSNGSLNGYAGGAERKLKLLQLEAAHTNTFITI